MTTQRRLWAVVVAIFAALAVSVTLAAPAGAINIKIPANARSHYGHVKVKYGKKYKTSLSKMTKKQKGERYSNVKYAGRAQGGYVKGVHHAPCTRCAAAPQKISNAEAKKYGLKNLTITTADSGNVRAATSAPARAPAAASAPVRHPSLATSGWAKVCASATTLLKDTPWLYCQRLDWTWSYKNNGQPYVVAISKPSQIFVKVYTWAKALGWKSEGRQDESLYDYYGDKWVYRSYSQGSFSYCPPRIFCYETVYPWITMDAYGDGTYGYTWGIS